MFSNCCEFYLVCKPHNHLSLQTNAVPLPPPRRASPVSADMSIIGTHFPIILGKLIMHYGSTMLGFTQQHT